MTAAPASLPRWRRILQKTALRARLAAHCLTSFDDDPGRDVLRVSFAQSGEDLIAWRLLRSLGIRRPGYFDIGAHHPIRLSNTALFHLFGFRGVNIEPDPVLFREFPRHRPHDLNLNVGIGPIAGDMTFFRMVDPLLNTFSREEAERIAREEGIAIAAHTHVRVETVEAVIARAGFTPDFVSLDTEGHDHAILQSWNFECHRPAVICVETLGFSTRAAGRKSTDIPLLLEAAGYRAYADTHINTIFVDARRRPTP